MEHERQDTRQEVKRAIQRDMSQQDRRVDGVGAFWRALSVVGMVGWPIALATVGGALIGRRLDLRYGTGVHFTLTLLTVGVGFGVYIAWKAINGRTSKRG